MISNKEFKYVKEKLHNASLPDDDSFVWDYYLKLCELRLEEISKLSVRRLLKFLSKIKDWKKELSKEELELGKI